ncbi:hypothetical protein EV122DRAFT_295582 [Schizophyllum commune]
MIIFPIQGSAVPCERVFSSVKETMTDRRSHITPNLMQELQVLKYALNHGMSFTAGLSREAELEMLDQVEDIPFISLT